MKHTSALSAAAFLAAASLVSGAPARADGVDYKSPPADAPLHLPAVSEKNAKIDVSGGAIDGEAGIVVTGAISLPVRHDIGFQIDGYGAAADDHSVIGAGAHLFWRDPSHALIGLYADIAHFDDDDREDDAGRIGAEIELYRGPVSVEMLIGGLYGREFDSNFFVEADLAYYLTPDFRLSAGYKLFDDESYGAAGFEYALAERGHPGTSLFGDVIVGEDYDSFRIGLRYYTGSPKPLIERHRQDDPKVRQPVILPEKDGKGGDMVELPPPD
jgi:hypothetical protein